MKDETEIQVDGLPTEVVEDLMVKSEARERESDARRAKSGDPGTKYMIRIDLIAGRVRFKKVAEETKQEPES